MKSFRDTKGRDWTIDVNVASARRVKAAVHVDIIGDGKVFAQLSADVEAFVNVLYVLCKAQADADGITDEQFGEGLAGDALEAATTALLEEIADFFPKDRRAVLRQVVTKMDEVQGRVAVAASAKLETLGPEIDAAIAAVFGASSTDSPAPVTSTPALSPSGS
jgi:hypothetical protein